jgi:hypothetical protein
MKKTLLSLSLLFTLAANAQLTQANHAPAVGNPIYATYQCDSTAIISGAIGANQTWNYPISGLNSLNTFTTAASTDITFNPANVSVSSATNNSSYYLASSTDLKYYGGVFSINGNVFTVKYSSPAIFALYSMSLNTSTTSITSGSVIALNQNGTFNGNCNVTADATGTLVLPAKTFTDVIRVNTVQTLTASLLGGALTVTLTYNNYDYYETSASKAAIFSISTSTLASSAAVPSFQKIVTVQKDYDIVGIKENQRLDIQLSVFPNPASNLINFTTSSTEAFKIIAFDVAGKIVASEIIETGKVKMNTDNFASGVYIYQVIGKNNEILTSGKFNVAK